MSSSRFPARVSPDGSLVPLHPERTKRRAGREVWVSIHDKPVVMRSDQANKYLWGVVYRRIAEESGGDPESIHYGLKRKAVEVGVLPPQYWFLGDNMLEDEPTTKVEDGVFRDYTAWIRHEAEHGTLLGTVENPKPFHIPEPNEGVA